MRSNGPFQRTSYQIRKGDFATNFVLQQKTAIDEKKVIRGKLSSKLLGALINIKMKPSMTPHDFFSS